MPLFENTLGFLFDPRGIGFSLFMLVGLIFILLLMRFTMKDWGLRPVGKMSARNLNSRPICR